MITYLQMVPHDRICEFLAKGWEIADELHGTNHGEYSCLMVWNGEGEPK